MDQLTQGEKSIILKSVLGPKTRREFAANIKKLVTVKNSPATYKRYMAFYDAEKKRTGTSDVKKVVTRVKKVSKKKYEGAKKVVKAVIKRVSKKKAKKPKATQEIQAYSNPIFGREAGN